MGKISGSSLFRGFLEEFEAVLAENVRYTSASKNQTK
jgi:hypothetical protein